MQGHRSGDYGVDVVCETPPAITTHARHATKDAPVRLGGHSADVRALCGAKLGWDTNLPYPRAVRCRACRERLP